MIEGVDLPLWVELVVAAGAVCTAALAVTALAFRLGVGVKWITLRVGTAVRQAVEDVVRELLAPITAELKPNHGSSLRDSVDRVERALDTHVETSSAMRASTQTDLEAWKRHSDRQFRHLWKRIGDVPIEDEANAPPPDDATAVG